MFSTRFNKLIVSKVEKLPSITNIIIFKLWRLKYYTDITNLRYDLTIESGFFKEHIDFNGEIKRTAESISFANMDEMQFQQVYSKFIDTVIRIMKWDNQMIEDNLESYL